MQVQALETNCLQCYVHCFEPQCADLCVHILLTYLLMVGAWQVHDWLQDARSYFQSLLQLVAAQYASLLFKLKSSYLHDLVTFLSCVDYNYITEVPSGLPFA